MTKGRTIVEGRGRWFFFSGGPGAPRYGDDPTKHAVNHDTESFVREVIQNANDQRLDNDDPVEVRFRFFSLSGVDRAEFLDALGWETGLKERLQIVADGDSGQGYNRFIDRIDDPDEDLRLLVVEDRNTTGLTGRWSEDSNYAALVRDELYSSKQDETAGGSYGLGKSVLWTFSGASTVLFNSYPTRSRDGKTLPRFVGRTKLPTHEYDEITYQGAGWLCNLKETNDGPRPESLWGEEAASIAERLHVSRPHVTGTSALVVGFRDPTRDTRPDLDDLAAQFVDAAVKYFWPAIHLGDLRVTVETPDATHEADVDEVPSIRPFVDCFADRHGETETVEQPGDVAGIDVPLNIPPRADGTETPDGPVRLASRFASPADDDTYQNHVALFRGVGMIVKYYDQSRVAFGDRNFHAVMACGEARADGETSNSDREIDRFLRFAEPPQHNDWESTENLREQYQRGFRTALEDMFGTMRDGLRHLIAKNDGDGNQLSKDVLGRFPIHDDRIRRRSLSQPAPAFEIESTSGFHDNRWQLEGEIGVLEDEFDGWSAEISMRGVGEDGATYERVAIESLETEPSDVPKEYDDGTVRVVVSDDISTLEFQGVTHRIEQGESREVSVGETQLEIQAELRIEEGE
jgi:hypothetical protein